MKYSILVQCALKPFYVVTGQSLSRVKDRVVKMEMKRGGKNTVKCRLIFRREPVTVKVQKGWITPLF